MKEDFPENKDGNAKLVEARSELVLPNELPFGQTRTKKGSKSKA